MASSESTAWVDGRVYTGRRKVEALLTEGGRVVAAGSSEEVRRSRPTGAVTRTLGHRVIVPGLVDSHCHIRSAVLREHGTDLAGCASVNELVDRMRESAHRTHGGPILGWGWDEAKFPSPHYPTRSDLDQVSNDRPVIAYRRCLHVAAVNSEALRALEAGGAMASEGPRPPAPAGPTPEGLLFDEALTSLVPLEARAFAQLGPDLVRWTHRAASRGLTTLVTMASDLDELAAIREAHRSSALPVRVRAYLRPDQVERLDAAPELRNGEDLRVSGVKLFADGALGPRTAWLSQSYDDAPGTRGRNLLEPARLTEAVRHAADRELTVAVHAIGDRAIKQILRVFRAEPPFGTPRIEHASVTPPELMPDLASVRPAIVVQPSFVTSDAWIAQRLGAERARWAYAFRSLIGLGLHVAGASDAPVETLDPWAGMTVATAPRAGPAEVERLSPAEALSLYTHEAGAALGEPAIGSLEPGAYADLVLLEARDWSDALRRGATSIAATYRSGVPVFERSSAPSGPVEPAAQAL